MKYATATFWEGLAERAISTFSQSLVGTSIFGLDWKGALSIAGTATIASVLKSFSLPEETDRAVATSELDAYTPRHASGLTVPLAG